MATDWYVRVNNVVRGPSRCRDSVSVKLLKTPLLLEKQHAYFSAAGGTKAQT
jgi:hypothetical protein